MMPLKRISFLLFLLTVEPSIAQFKVVGKIKQVNNTGFHEIALPPSIRSYSNQNLSDIRLLNSSGKEIPYFIQDDPKSTTSIFEEYKIISKEVRSNRRTTVILSIPGAEESSSMTLFIANSDSEKSYSLSGSNDLTSWFGLSNAKVLNDLNSYTKTYTIKEISYPLNSYKYLKIVFNDKQTLPINILKVGNYKTISQKKFFDEISPRETKINESKIEKETIIHVNFGTPQIINQISFKISRPNYYRRKAVLFKKTYDKNNQISPEVITDLISFELNSNTQNTFKIDEVFEQEIYFRIENQDNFPLKISKITYSQKPISIIAELNKDEIYTLKQAKLTQRFLVMIFQISKIISPLYSRRLLFMISSNYRILHFLKKQLKTNLFGRNVGSCGQVS